MLGLQIDAHSDEIRHNLACSVSGPLIMKMPKGTAEKSAGEPVFATRPVADRPEQSPQENDVGQEGWDLIEIRARPQPLSSPRLAEVL